MRLTSWRYIIPEPFKSLRRNLGMSIAAVMTMVITLFLCGVMGILVLNIDANAKMLEDSVAIKIFIEDDINQEAMDTLSAEVKATEGVESVLFVSRAQGLADMSSNYGSSEEILAAIETNPLPNSYTVKATHPDLVAGLAEQFETFDNVATVRYGQDSVEAMFVFMNWVRALGMALMGLLGFSAVILISMNIRLSVEARKEEIQVMKYVGASNSFITWPFILEGMLLGLLGAIIASIITFSSYGAIADILATSLSFMDVVALGSIAAPGVLLMLFVGLFLGAIGSAIAVRKHINV